MRGFNKAIIAGNLTKDPDVRYTVNKRAFARFGVAVNYRYKDANGEYQEGTDFINVVAWGSLGETCGKYLKKGSPVLIEGRIRTDTYEARDGSGKRTMTEIVADNMVMLGSRQGGDSGGYSYGRTGSSGYSSSGYGMTPPDDSEFGSINDHGFGGEEEDFGGGTKASELTDESKIPF